MLRSAFHLMDKNGDGWLTKEEMLGTIRSDPLVRAVLNTSSVLRPLLHPSTFMATFAAMDANHDGRVTLPELERVASRLVTKAERQRLERELARLIFSMLDRDGDGVVTEREMLMAIRDNGEMRRIVRGSSASSALQCLLRPRAFARALAVFRERSSTAEGKRAGGQPGQPGQPGVITLEEFEDFALGAALIEDGEDGREAIGEDPTPVFGSGAAASLAEEKEGEKEGEEGTDAFDVFAQIDLRSAAGLSKADGLFGKSDPYAILFLDDVEVARTEVIKSTLEPVWKRGVIEVRLPLLPPAPRLRVEVRFTRYVVVRRLPSSSSYNVHCVVS